MEHYKQEMEDYCRKKDEEMLKIQNENKTLLKDYEQICEYNGFLRQTNEKALDEWKDLNEKLEEKEEEIT